MSARLTSNKTEARTNFEAVRRLEERLCEVSSGFVKLRAVGTELQTAQDRSLALLAEHDALAVNVGHFSADRDTAISRVEPLQAEVLIRDQELGDFIKPGRRLKAKVPDAGSCALSVETCIPGMAKNTVQLRVLTEDLIGTVVEEHAHVVGLVYAEMSCFVTDVSSAPLTSRVRATKTIDAFSDEVPSSTSGTAVDASSIHAS